jgi:dihydroorotate dehydrogenase electron transfer subunit
MKKDSCARIDRKESWGHYFLLSLESPQIAQDARPGQFLMVRTSLDTHPLLRRPFSIFSSDGTRVEIFFQKVGLGTRLLSEKREGDTVDIIGPLGVGFTVIKGNAGEKGNEDELAALIGGGRGIAPLYFLAKELQGNGGSARVFYGGKSVSDLPTKERFENSGIPLICATEDGSFGTKGLITEVFEAALRSRLSVSQIYACGPDLMLKRIAEIASANNIPAELSLESVMGCGFGACWGCVKKIKKDNRASWHKICEEGPVIKAEDIVWELEDK